jgi:site-specific DNA-methyltransferase (adenine-specific)/modification methylase
MLAQRSQNKDGSAFQTHPLMRDAEKHTCFVLSAVDNILLEIAGPKADKLRWEKLKDIIVWDKKHAEPAIQSQVLNRRTELILVFENDYPISRQFRSAVFKRGTLSDIWQIGKNRKKKRNADKTHGAAFPEELVTTIINNFTKDKDVIYDPFLGTGTTAVVAKKLNRRFIGSEILKDYYKIAQKRIREVGDLI